MSTSTKCQIAFSCVLSTLAACSQGTATDAGTHISAQAAEAASGSSQWQTNGAAACDKYLTPDQVSKILPKSAGKTRQLSADDCDYEAADSGNSASIGIRLSGHISPEMFKAVASHLENPVPLQGVGDMAVRSGINGSYILVEAIKGNDRYCEIKVVVSSRSFINQKNEELGQELGTICNKLFALP